MVEKLVYKIQNLFNGDVLIYEDKKNAVEYITLCMLKQIPIEVNYMYKSDTNTQIQKGVVQKIVA